MHRQTHHPIVQCPWCSWGELRTSQDRGVTKHVMCEDKHNYSCVDTQACRGATGIHTIHYALEKNNPNSQKRIIKLFWQTEELYARFVDTDQIRLVKKAVDFVEAKKFSVPQESAKKANATIYGAYASGVNVYLSSHWDQDFTYCATSIHQRKPYLESQKVVAYFVFPRLGITISLRPGDNLFFNPKEPHCISLSQICQHWKEWQQHSHDPQPIALSQSVQ